jgi:pimeloyl-ACP methyl ester carboxylesterase
MVKLLERSFQIGDTEATIRGDIRWKADSGTQAKFPLLVICHGFKAFKDWGPFPAIGRFFAEHGFVSIVFNFSHNGIGDEPRKFSEREKFSVNTISRELEDVDVILNAVERNKFSDVPIDRSKIGMIGHSRGGGVALIKAKEDERIKAVSGWSTISHFDRYTEEQKQRWREKGYVELPSMNALSVFRMTTAFIDDLDNNAERLDIIKAVGQLHKPFLIIQGTADIPVPRKEAELLYNASDKSLTEIVFLEGAGHMYGARHPYKKESQNMTRVLELTSTWFHKNLS